MKKLSARLNGYAILFNDLRTEYWVYDPSILTVKQRKILGILAWKTIALKVSEDDHG